MGQMADSEREKVVLDLAIESLRKSGSLRLRVQGTSMLPTIRPGSCVEIRQATADGILTGDIVLTKTSAGLRLHRVVEIRRGLWGSPMFVTRGDNHWHTDLPVDATEVLGKLA
jgi:Peptidase S24-like